MDQGVIDFNIKGSPTLNEKPQALEKQVYALCSFTFDQFCIDKLSPDFEELADMINDLRKRGCAGGPNWYECFIIPL